MARLTKEEKTNKEFIKIILDSVMYDELHYNIIPNGCHIQVECLDPHTLEVVEHTLKDQYVEQQLETIRGNIRVTYNKFIKQG
mgnify:CR=1 FL=1